MGNKVSRYMRNYDAERRAFKLLSRNDQANKTPARAPRFESEREMLRKVAKDPRLDEAVNSKDTRLLENLSQVKVVSSNPTVSQTDEQKKQPRPLPQRRHFLPTGYLGVPEVPPESVPPGRLTLMQFQELLNTQQPQGSGLTSDKIDELLKFYAALIQRTQGESTQMADKGDNEEASAGKDATELK